MSLIREKFETRKLPMMPIRDVVIFPFMMTPFVVGRESSVRALEEAGMILRRVALLDPVKVGANVSVFIQVTLEKQTEAVLEVFEASVAGLPEVMECYLMTGDSDYLLRVVVPDIVALQNFIVGRLSKTRGVANIRSSFALKQVKYKTALPLEDLLDR